MAKPSLEMKVIFSGGHPVSADLYWCDRNNGISGISYTVNFSEEINDEEENRVVKWMHEMIECLKARQWIELRSDTFISSALRVPKPTVLVYGQVVWMPLLVISHLIHEKIIEELRDLKAASIFRASTTVRVSTGPERRTRGPDNYGPEQYRQAVQETQQCVHNANQILLGMPCLVLNMHYK